MPMEAPMMPASASGLSITRRPPKRRCRSSVTRKTPPSTPTSSPMMTTSGSRSISSRRARFSALTILSFAMARLVSPARGRCRSWCPPGGPSLATHGRRGGINGALRRGSAQSLEARGQLRALRGHVRGKLGIRVIEHLQRIRGQHGLEALYSMGDLLVHLLVYGRVEQLLLLQIDTEARERVLLLPGLDLFLRAVLGRVVSRGVHAQAIGDAFDQRRPISRPSPVHRLAARRVHGEHVVAVHLDARKAVGGGLLGDGAGIRLLLERHGDGPLIVLADEDHRPMPDTCEVSRLVKIALRRRAIAEVDHHHRVLAPVLDAVGNADGMR